MEKNSSSAAQELGRKGGRKTAERGPEYYAQIQAKRENRGGGRPKNPPKAEFEGELAVGAIRMSCAVLEDGTRVLSERSVTKTLGGKRGGSHWVRKQAGAELPVFLSANNLKPFISNELELALTKPLLYFPKGGGAAANGVRAELLPAIFDVWLSARKAGKLKPSQIHIAEQAEVLIRALAGVAMVALVDEATGYQFVRARTALQEVLEKFISTEFRKWVKTFPDDFYRELFRLKHWVFKEDTVRKTPQVGKLTLDLVYDRLAPGVRQRLEEVNPKNEKGYRKHKHFQRLTEDVGDPALRAHLASVITLMKVSDDWDGFKVLMNRALPRYPTMPLFDQPEQKLLAGN